MEPQLENKAAFGKLGPGPGALGIAGLVGNEHSDS